MLFDTTRRFHPVPAFVREAAVSSDGSYYMVVWGDDRSSATGVFGARFDRNGRLLDSAGIVVSRFARAWCPAIAWDGSNYLVVWTDGGSQYGDIRGARVSRTGVLLDSLAFSISSAAQYQKYPALAFDGTNYLVVWQDGRNSSSDIYGARVTRQGAVLDPNGIAICRATATQGYPRVAFDGGNYLVVWSDARASSNSDIYGARVATNGQVLDTAGIMVCSATGVQSLPDVSFGSPDYLVTWSDARSTSAVYGARVTTGGAVRDPDGFRVSPSGRDCGESPVAFDGTNFLVAWKDNQTNRPAGARVSPTGAVLDPNGIAIITSGTCTGRLALARGSDFMVSWYAGQTCGARVSSSGSALDPSGVLLSMTANYQRNPAVGFDGTNYLVVYEDTRRYPNCGLYACRISTTGQVLDPGGMPICTTGAGCFYPAIAFDGTNYLVAWEDERNEFVNIYAARVSRSGAVLDPGGFQLSPLPNEEQWEPAVAYGGNCFLIVWTDWRTGDFSDIYGCRVSRAGVPLDTAGIRVSTADDDQQEPDVAFDGTNFVAVWTDARDPDDWDIAGAGVSQSGQVLDPSGIILSTADHEEERPAIAFDGNNYLVVWEQTQAMYYGIGATRLSPARFVLDPEGIDIVSDTNGWFYPDVASDGARWLVVMERGKDSGMVESQGARLDTSGAVYDIFPLTLTFGGVSEPALAHGTGNRTILVTSGWASTVQGKAYNAVRALMKLGPFPGVEEGHGHQATSITPEATVVKGMLHVMPNSLTAHSYLLSVSGRKVLELHPGANDVSRLAPGVYFVSEQTAGSRQQAGIRKVVIQR
jgi:hypothetical protein